MSTLRCHPQPLPLLLIRSRRRYGRGFWRCRYEEVSIGVVIIDPLNPALGIIVKDTMPEYLVVLRVEPRLLHHSARIALIRLLVADGIVAVVVHRARGQVVFVVP